VKPSIRLFTVFGIDIGVHYTWVFAFVLITWSLASGAYPDLFGRWSRTEYWAAGIISSLVLFAFVLVHELAHSLVAKRKGLPVKGITLFIFGGVSNLGAESKRAWDEFAIAIVGPLSSLAIGGALLGLYFATGPERVQDTQPVQGVIFYSGWINVAVGAFNLIPGFPLDGGRVLRSIIWGVTGSMRRATGLAANVGRVVAWGLIAFGLYRVLEGDWLGGLWTAFIGWFLNNAADAAKREQEAEYEFTGALVRDVMQPDPVTVPPAMSVDELVRECFIKRGCRAAAVMESGRLVGIVSLTDVRRLGPSDWATTPVAAVMTVNPLHTVASSESVDLALKLLAEKNINQAMVVDGGQLVGMIGRESLMRFVRVRRELGVRRPGA